jgi:hypothetical protein
MRRPTKSRVVLERQNVKHVKTVWLKNLSRADIRTLREITTTYGFSVPLGDLLLLDGKWYVTHAGLLRLASRRRCRGIDVEPVQQFCDPGALRWAFKATVFKSNLGKTFVGYGDAVPDNVSPLVRGAEMRVAETRAVNRALRKAYGIGICSVEELGSLCGLRPSAAGQKIPVRGTESANGNGHHPLRDRLHLLIRQHQLDAVQVKAYAADYCEVAELRQASREQVAGFIKHLAEYAQSDREGLLCELNGYAPKSVREGLVTIATDSAPKDGEKAAGAA